MTAACGREHDSDVRYTRSIASDNKLAPSDNPDHFLHSRSSDAVFNCVLRYEMNAKTPLIAPTYYPESHRSILINIHSSKKKLLRVLDFLCHNFRGHDSMRKSSFDE
jgi:hypothetical protein